MEPVAPRWRGSVRRRREELSVAAQSRDFLKKILHLSLASPAAAQSKTKTNQVAPKPGTSAPSKSDQQAAPEQTLPEVIRDLSRLPEKVRKTRFAIDQEKLRKYFPTDKSIDFTFAISQRFIVPGPQDTALLTWPAANAVNIHAFHPALRKSETS